MAAGLPNPYEAFLLQSPLSLAPFPPSDPCVLTPLYPNLSCTTPNDTEAVSSINSSSVSGGTWQHLQLRRLPDILVSRSAGNSTLGRRSLTKLQRNKSQRRQTICPRRLDEQTMKRSPSPKLSGPETHREMKV
ncbi:hypothetical protein EYF80_036434 [Liparis tanakae]|uniref:Uncharacterized protein n=1 Tax=Liparis tanakae TaxID=230148 RepID=A0A4Z2GIQ5_9TELE|nr:hypothetical protein EYF80_036434 [Liparis tanakae]